MRFKTESSLIYQNTKRQWDQIKTILLDQELCILIISQTVKFRVKYPSKTAKSE